MFISIKEKFAPFNHEAFNRAKIFLKLVITNFIFLFLIFFGIILVTIVCGYEVLIYGKQREDFERDVGYKLFGVQDGSHN